MPFTARETVRDALEEFRNRSLKVAARAFLDTLGYRSERSLAVPASSPSSFLDLFAQSRSEVVFDQGKGLVSEWKTADLLFQLTDQELSRETNLFSDNSVQAGLQKSYVFIAIELKDRDYARGKFSAIARQINRIFPMPVMVLFKHQDRLTIAVINRRQHKRDAAKDVLGKVTLIRDISFSHPHPGHLDILASFAVANLVHPQRLPINNFDALHSAWEEIFNVELLNKRFYRELANWYFWALPQVGFPADIEKDDEKRRATGLIRLLTRLIFCWFLKEKGLIPEKLFVEAELKDLLKDLSPDASTYHQAILQNLFFATLNQRMGKDKNGQPFRGFAKDEGFQKNRATYGVDTLYRYEEQFRHPATALAEFADVPFLNGGLFECLDRTEEGTDRKLYLDGFSRNKKKRPTVPNRLFFGSEHEEDLSEAYGDTKRKREKVRGLLRILHSYKFTIVENTPIDQEIALDPELLGKVFENLLASYNEETKTTARKQTGSFYTPRPIVEYMVDESLKAHLTRALTQAGMSESDAQAGLDILFAYTEREHPFREREIAALLDAIHTCKILDPACGSGAFPMGMLQKLVYIIHKLDPDNARWKQLQIDAAAKIPDPSSREAAITAIERDFADNEDDYGRKLYLIENCLYGVDIQPIAIQISKLRFFISLVCDQRTNRSKKENHGIRALPNLETKFVAADTLVGLPEIDYSLLVDPRINKIEVEIETLYHSHFAIQRRDQKLALQRKIKDLRQELGTLLADSVMAPKKAQHVADWDPFDPQASSDFFDPHWMFGRSLSDGFDVVLGNPPYLASYSRESVKMSEDRKGYFAQHYTATSGRINTFILFIERSCTLANRTGHVSFIIPKPFLMMTAYQKTRRMIMALRTEQIVACRDAVFTGACVPTCILLFQNDEAERDHFFKIFEYDQDGFKFLRSSPISRVLDDSECRINVTASESAHQIMAQMLDVPTNLSDFCRVEDGINPGPFREWLVTEEKVSEKCVKLIEGRNFHRYTPIEWKGKWFLWDKAAIKVRQKEHPNSIAVLGDESRFLADAKIVTRQTADGIIATLDKKQFFSTNSVHTTRLREGISIDLRYILGVMNSGLMRFFFQNQFKEKENAFPQVKVNKLRKIPIPHLPHRRESVLGNLVSCLLVEKGRQANSGAASFLDGLIDACTMECYFHAHMAERDLLFLDDLAPQFATYDSGAPESRQRDFVSQLHRTLNAPSSKIRNRLLRISADSPDFLAVIKEEGGA